MPLFTSDTFSHHLDQLTIGLSQVLFPIVVLLGDQRPGRRHPQHLRALHDPGDRAAGLERRDHRRAGHQQADVPRRQRDVRLRARRAAGDDRAAGDVDRGAAARRLQVPVRVRLARRPHRAGLPADAAGHDQPRDHQLRPADQLLARHARERGGAARDRRRLPHLHAAAGHVQRRGRDRAVPGPVPLRRPPRPARPAPHDGRRHAPDLDAADAGGRDHDGAGGADHAARLPARRVRRRVDRARLHRALLVLLQPPVLGPQPAAVADLLLAPETVDPDRPLARLAGRQRRRQPRALQAVRRRRSRDRHGRLEHRDGGRPGVGRAQTAARLAGGEPRRSSPSPASCSPRRSSARPPGSSGGGSTTRSAARCRRRSSPSGPRSRPAAPSTSPRSCTGACRRASGSTAASPASESSGASVAAAAYAAAEPGADLRRAVR